MLDFARGRPAPVQIRPPLTLAPINMKLMKLLALGALLVSLTLASAALAALPDTKNKEIVPGKSVAGVSLGMQMTAAANVWKMGPGQSCFRELPTLPYRCIFEIASSGANYNLGYVYYEGEKKVERIGIVAPHDGVRPSFKSKVNQYKTSNGIGIGTQLGKLRSTFGKKLKLTTSAGSERVFTAIGPGKATTSFTLYGAQVRSISLALP